MNLFSWFKRKPASGPSLRFLHLSDYLIAAIREATGFEYDWEENNREDPTENNALLSNGDSMLTVNVSQVKRHIDSSFTGLRFDCEFDEVSIHVRLIL